MARPKPLAPTKLKATLSPSAVPYADSAAIPAASRRTPPPQPRALKALEMALSIKDAGYNVYVAGEPGLGRSYMVREFLAPRAAKRPTPPDLAYVFNFDDPDRPRLVQLPAGLGRLYRDALRDAVGKIRKEIPLRAEGEPFQKKRGQLMDAFQEARDGIYERMEKEAKAQGFNLNLDDDGGVTLYPLVEGKLLSEDEFEKLDPGLKKTLKVKGDKLLDVMSGLLRKVGGEEDGLKEGERKLDEDLVRGVLKDLLDPVAADMRARRAGKGVREHLEALAEDMVAHADEFLAKPEAQAQPMAGLFPPQPEHGAEDFFVRYEVNLFVEQQPSRAEAGDLGRKPAAGPANGAERGAPVIVEDHPTTARLLGTVERESDMGALITDFTLIKAGALHRANGGFLILHMEDMLQHPPAWEGLMRALRSGLARLEEGEGDQTKTKSIEPEPLPLDVKVLIVGSDDLYETLLAHEDRFPKLFKIKAHLQETVDRDAAAIKAYVRRLGCVAEEACLLPFSRAALAGLVDYASTLAEDQRKLSLKYPLVRELMIEAEALARMARKKTVDAGHLHEATRARAYRANLYEEAFMEEYDRQIIKVETDGKAVGRVNGLSVTWFGDYEFGLPHQIAATVGVGYGGIVDLERESMLGGPIHTKAMMILKSYLVDRFAKDKPIMLTGSLCFEQSYAQVEGDSASGAELAALLSALADAPNDLSLAFTGAVNQSGLVMAVGGVTRKVEGYFEVCRRHGLTGRQGVIIPADVVENLMLSDEVVDAVSAGTFAIYPVRRIEEAVELLTGLPAGKRGAKGYTPGSLFARVDQRLRELADYALDRMGAAERVDSRARAEALADEGARRTKTIR